MTQRKPLTGSIEAREGKRGTSYRATWRRGGETLKRTFADYDDACDFLDRVHRKLPFGSIEERVGKTTVAYRAIWMAEGQRQTRTFDTYEDAEDFLDEQARAIRAGGKPTNTRKAQTPFRELIEEWWKHTQESGDLALATLDKRRSILDAQILPQFGERPVGSITRKEIQAWVNGLDRSPSSVRSYHSLLLHIFREVYADDPAYLPNGMPLGNRLIKLPKPRSRMTILTEKQEKRVLKRSRKQFPAHHVMIHLEAHTGLRLGEILALGRHQYHRKGRYLLIDRALDANNKIKPATKTSKPRRVDLFDCCVALLDEHLATVEDALGECELIFPGPQGGLQNPDNFRHRVWKPLLEAAELDEDVHFHDLRHTHTTRLLSAGWDVIAVAERLGHASPKMTLDVYGHYIEGRQRALIKAMRK